MEEVSSRVLAVPAAQSSSCSGPLGLQGLTGFLCASASKLTSSEDLAPKPPPTPAGQGPVSGGSVAPVARGEGGVGTGVGAFWSPKGIF